MVDSDADMGQVAQGPEPETPEKQKRKHVSFTEFNEAQKVDYDQQMSTEDALYEIGKIIAKSQQPSEVAAILRAMRGPDDMDQNAKWNMTVPVRVAAFGSQIAQFFGDNDNATWERQTSKLPHYQGAVGHAAALLGLTKE